MMELIFAAGGFVVGCMFPRVASKVRAWVGPKIAALKAKISTKL